MIKVSRIFLFMIIGALLFSLMEGGYLPYTIFYGMLSILITGYIYMFIQGRCMDTEILLKQGAKTAGDTIEYLTIVKCKSLLPVPYILVRNMSIDPNNNVSCELVNITLSENSWIEREITFYKRGVYDIGCINLKLFDILNIFQYDKTVDAGISIKVYPKVYQIKRLFIGGKDIYDENKDINSNNEDMYTVRNIRKYREGDSLTRIHWKISAKHGELYVKESDTISGEDYSIFVDMGYKNNTLDLLGLVEEHIVDLTVSMCSHMKLNGRVTRVYMNIKKPVDFKIEGNESFNSLMEFMIHQKSDGEMDFEDFIYENLQRLNKNDGLVVITASLDERLVQTMISIKNSGYTLLLFYCGSEITKENVDRLISNGVSAFGFNDILEE